MSRRITPTSILQRTLKLLRGRGLRAAMLLALMCGMIQPMSAQNIFTRVDSFLTKNYRKVRYDTTYMARPQRKWLLIARVNFSGASIMTEGIDDSALTPGSSSGGQHFKSRMKAKNKTTLSLGVGYQGIVLSLALNPAKLAGKYRDYEFNLNCYRRNLGCDVIYHDAKNFTGWYDQEGMPRINMPKGILRVQTLNLNGHYVFNHRRFSYPSAFSQSYIQHRSAGSFLLAASCMAQRATLDTEQKVKLKVVNVGIGGGYGYNYVPKKGWLLHASLLPTLIAYSYSSLTEGKERRKDLYRFPEFIVTARGSVVRHWGNKFLGISMVYNYTNMGDRDDFAVYNNKWRLRAFFGLRI
ncbi:MAG: DUF4421 family protein [Bacteroidaceae bacterium]|nr:DUF4421 family protein [Bacteroidaceae bacterium]